MATIALEPIILTDVILVVGTDNYEAHVSKVQFNPTTPLVKWKGLTPTSQYSFPGTSDWTLTLEYAQDWKTANALSQYLLANAGQSKSVTFKPKKPTTTGPTWTATVIMAPGPIGGAVDTVPTGAVTLGVVGVPVLTTA